MEIKNAVILVTGASAGIGAATARLLTKLGAKVALVARSADKLKALAAELPGSFAVVADMSHEADVRRMVAEVAAKFGRIDILINNAGRGMYGSVDQSNLVEFRIMMELNVFGPIAAMQAVAPIMRKQGGGLILNISSQVSKMYLPGLGAYAATKYALNALSLTARTELATDNIRVGVVLPGMTATDFGHNAYGKQPDWSTRPAGPMPGTETADQVAQRIVDAIHSEEAEVFTDNARR